MGLLFRGFLALYGICQSFENPWICALTSAKAWAALYEKLAVAHATGIPSSRYRLCSRNGQGAIQIDVRINRRIIANVFDYYNGKL